MLKLTCGVVMSGFQLFNVYRDVVFDQSLQQNLQDDVEKALEIRIVYNVGIRVAGVFGMDQRLAYVLMRSDVLNEHQIPFSTYLSKTTK